MYVCPACNGLQKVIKNCSDCEEHLTDEGKLVDYLDEYSPYLDDEGLKLVDGDPESTEDHVCVHLLRCPKCGTETHVKVSEQSS
ncbi:hypothetical protein [Pontibacillus sp. HMF3514]|uniref:hypothetical protein n=1 Tax=Pontibacillus sp. HMF3514 TaxID=2692425 RepID=UPI00131FB280|nr:hypothetical protein [Pontibacillus sp. HMF3514]QHE51319.1 hypothetical protein GS400_04405 [Pontibacillus sp. HMF3514]